MRILKDLSLFDVFCPKHIWVLVIATFIMGLSITYPVQSQVTHGELYTFAGEDAGQDLFGSEYEDSCVLAGDVNNDGGVSTSDWVTLLEYLFKCGEVACFEQSDVNGNCEIDYADFEYLFNYLVNMGPVPVPYCSYPDTFYDPGEKDTVRLETAEAIPGSPFVIPMSIFNDSSVQMIIPLRIEDTTRVVLDSIVFDGTRGEGLLYADLDYSCGGSSGIIIYPKNPTVYLPSGNGISGYLWGHVKDCVDTGFVKLDTSFLEPTHQLRFFKSNSYSLIPEFAYGGVRILFAYICGDLNDDCTIGLSDVVYFINYMFKHGPAPQCEYPYLACADITGNGEVTVKDLIILINYLFKGGPAPIC